MNAINASITIHSFQIPQRLTVFQCIDALKHQFIFKTKWNPKYEHLAKFPDLDLFRSLQLQHASPAWQPEK